MVNLHGITRARAPFKLNCRTCVWVVERTGHDFAVFTKHHIYQVAVEYDVSCVAPSGHRPTIAKLCPFVACLWRSPLDSERFKKLGSAARRVDTAISRWNHWLPHVGIHQKYDSNKNNPGYKRRDSSCSMRLSMHVSSILDI